MECCFFPQRQCLWHGFWTGGHVLAVYRRPHSWTRKPAVRAVCTSRNWQAGKENCREKTKANSEIAPQPKAAEVWRKTNLCGNDETAARGEHHRALETTKKLVGLPRKTAAHSSVPELTAANAGWRGHTGRDKKYCLWIPKIPKPQAYANKE